MSSETSRKLSSLVADAGAFLRNVELQNFAEKIFTLTDVVSEIRDQATRSRLAVLPYTLEFREPSVDSIKHVTEFSKKTGDYRSLSAVDLRVIALSYQLEKEFCNVTHINDEPAEKVDTTAKSSAANNPLWGFYSEQKGKVTNKEDVSGPPNDNESMDLVSQTDNHPVKEGDPSGLESQSIHDCSRADKENVPSISMDTKTTTANVDQIPPFYEVKEQENEPTVMENVDLEEKNSEEEDMEDDDEGWISPQNIKKVKDDMGMKGDLAIGETDIKNACFTTDFAMQNVLIQMGLHVVSVNGMLIQQARSYVLKCHGCFKETTAMDRQFCANCGNKTLMKVAVTASADGTVQYHYPRRRPFNIRGTKYSLPRPKGGRSNEGPVLVEDQRAPQNRLPKKKDSPNPLDPDFIARASPFAPKDVTSKAFNHGYHVRVRDWRNPNEAKKNSGKKKR